MSSRKRKLDADPQSSSRAPENAGFTPAAAAVSQTEIYERQPGLPLERLGDLLRRVRGERRDDLQQIADYLCIRRGFLEALEDSRYDELPADAYAVGFLRSYAQYLGLDDQDAIERYRHEMEGRRKKPVLVVPQPISGGRTPSALIMIGAVVAAILIYILWYALSGPSAPPATPVLPQAELAAPELPTNAGASVTANAGTAPSANAPSSIVPAPVSPAAAPIPANAAPLALAPATPAVKPASRITITAEQSSWVLVSDAKGHAVFDKVLKPGETYSVPDTPGLFLTTGNGGGVAVSIDGVDLPKLAEGPSHVLRNIPLDAEHLKALTANKNE